MSSAQRLREFIQQRLTAAAEEIFTEFGKTIVRYEEEIDRQRRLLDISCKPETELHTTDLSQLHVYQEQEVLADQRFCHEERSSGLDQEEPQIKEEQEELCTSEEREQLVLKEESYTLMLTANYEGSEPEPKRYQLLSHSPPVAENQNQEGCRNVESGSTRHRSRSHINSAEESLKSESQSDTGSQSLKCNVCGNAFMDEHHRIDADKKPYSCETCGKSFYDTSTLKRHKAIHTGEKPYGCKTCGKSFAQKGNLTVHMRMHTGDKPYSCKTCGKSFAKNSTLLIHIRTHTGEKPYRCNRCGEMFTRNSHLLRHMKAHAGQKAESRKLSGGKTSALEPTTNI